MQRLSLTRRQWLPLLLGLVLVAGLLSSSARAISLDAGQIKAALGTATPEEDGFIERCIAMVESGRLPADLFESCFLWAKKKPRHRFQYFRQALIFRAGERGITVR